MFARITNRNVAITMNGSSCVNVFVLIAKGMSIAEIPMMRPIFAMFEPIIFPIAISGRPEIADIRDTMNSGNEVPNATIVNPIIIGLTLRNLAISEDPFTRKFAPLPNSANDIANNITVITMSSIY